VDHEQVPEQQARERPVQERVVQRPAERPRGEQREEPVRECEGEDQYVRDPVRGQTLIVAAQPGEVPQDVDVPVRQRLRQPVEHPGDERGVPDVDRPAKDPALSGVDLVTARVEDRCQSRTRRRGRGGGTHSTITFPAMMWWPSPQYSWQSIWYSPGSRNVYVVRVTCPGISMTLTRVPGIISPCNTSVDVATKVISAPTGTRISVGVKLHALPIITAS